MNICKAREFLWFSELLCWREPGYQRKWVNQFAVAVTKDSTIVGHMPSQFVRCSCGSLEASVATLFP